MGPRVGTGRSSVRPSCSPAQRGSSGCWDLPLWVTSTSEPRMGGVVSPRQLPAAPHPCPNLCPLFSTRLGCFFCPISRWFSPTFSVKSLQQSPSLVSEEPWAQGWSGLGGQKVKKNNFKTLKKRQRRRFPSLSHPRTVGRETWPPGSETSPETNPDSTWSSDSCLQNCEIVNICGLSPQPVALCYFSLS